MLTVAVRRCDHYRGVAETSLNQLVNRAEDWDIGAEARRAATSALDIGVDQRGQRATPGFLSKLMNVKRMDDSHAAHSDDSDFERFRHFASALVYPKIRYSYLRGKRHDSTHPARSFLLALSCRNAPGDRDKVLQLVPQPARRPAAD